MNFKPINCPECGERGKGTLERVHGCALLDFAEDGSATYSGETKMFWDEQHTITADGSAAGKKAALVCPNGHTWDAAVDWSD